MEFLAIEAKNEYKITKVENYTQISNSKQIKIRNKTEKEF